MFLNKKYEVSQLSTLNVTTLSLHLGFYGIILKKCETNLKFIKGNQYRKVWLKGPWSYDKKWVIRPPFFS